MAFDFEAALAEVRRQRSAEAERIAALNSNKSEKIGDLYRQFEIFKDANGINVKASIKEYTLSLQKSSHSMAQVIIQDNGLFSARTVDPGGFGVKSFNHQDLNEDELAMLLADWSTI